VLNVEESDKWVGFRKYVSVPDLKLIDQLVQVNLHTDSAPPSIFELISGKFGPGFDPNRPQGKRVQEAALAYRFVLRFTCYVQINFNHWVLNILLQFKLSMCY
jgi:hypothetical protein